MATLTNSYCADGAGSSRKLDTNSVAEIRDLLRAVPLIDGHNDLPWEFRRQKGGMDGVDLTQDTRALGLRLVTDIPRLRAGGVGGQFWSVYVPPTPGGASAVQAVVEQIDVVHRLVRRYPDTFELALTASDIERIHHRGRIASLIGMEGGHSIGNSLAVLRMTYGLGARYMTLTHTKNVDWADAAGDVREHHGLTAFGVEVVQEMNRLGMMVDLAHVTDETMRAALRATRAPVIFSHSSARALCDTSRNVPDDVLEMVRTNGGLVMVCFLPGYLTPENYAHFTLAMAEKERLGKLYPEDYERIQKEMEPWRRAHPSPRSSLSDVADHIDHVRKVAGIDHVGIGSDFEGFHGAPEGLEDVSCYPALLAELRRRGYTVEELRKVAGLNLLRVFREVERVAARLQGG